MVQISLHFIKRALFDFHIGFRLMKSSDCLVDIRLRGIFVGEELLCARRADLREFESRLRAGHIALSLSDRRLKQDRIYLSDDIAGFHLGIKIDKELLNVPRNLAAHLHVNDRVKRTRGGDGLGDRPAGDNHSLESLPGAAPALAQEQPGENHHDDSNHER